MSFFDDIGDVVSDIGDGISDVGNFVGDAAEFGVNGVVGTVESIPGVVNKMGDWAGDAVHSSFIDEVMDFALGAEAMHLGLGLVTGTEAGALLGSGLSELGMTTGQLEQFFDGALGNEIFGIYKINDLSEDLGLDDIFG